MSEAERQESMKWSVFMLSYTLNCAYSLPGLQTLILALWDFMSISWLEEGKR